MITPTEFSDIVIGACFILFFFALLQIIYNEYNNYCFTHDWEAWSTDVNSVNGMRIIGGWTRRCRKCGCVERKGEI